ncbi:phage major capsid protein [Pseudorhodoplanes sinuspersici]|uniref:Phage major capsid protein n=1 Tax=Pseudorhodoplanes sinuspersici TaxID=1235591 RepID=A0A1W6ZXM5_9HYPH|nr:phage major capsid protein [Pseudorhodoplanes sinuspersici]ARQ01891.1 phage major capsid protein [Pseudorhodoplanes sinuspersici]RKE73656.1 HK97 family phage major capsid protein [Pseudorhodoplanes sinuspersici]
MQNIIPTGLVPGAAALAAPSSTRARGLVGFGARADASDATKILNELKSTFEAFKAERDKEIADLKKGLGDVVQTEKVDRINAEITKLQTSLDEVNSVLAALRVGGGGGSGLTTEQKAHKDAFNQFFRKGVDNGLVDLEVKAGLRSTSDPDGGALVPEEQATTIEELARTASVMRQLASVITISTGTYKKLVNLGGAGYGWVGETQARPETSTPTLAELAFNVMEIYANPAATQTLLDDARVDIAAWLGNEVAQTFADQEGAAFVAGDGVLKPRGILGYDIVANGSYAWGKLGYVPTGVAAALSDASNNGTDALIDLYYSLKSTYRNGASWLMSDAVMGTVRKFKDGDDNYIWAPPTSAAEMATVLGKPVYNDDNMQAVGAGNYPIAFGNFARGYLIVDRFGIRVLRDPYTNKPWVHFYTTKRVGGGVQNFEAIKLLKVATS